MNNRQAQQPGCENDGGTPTSTPAPAPAAATEPTFDLWRFTHRSLRGRYRVACVIGVAGAVVGAGTGLMLAKRLYTASGLVRVASVLPPLMKETDQNRPIAMFDGYIQAQRDVMLSPEMISAAMESDAWTKPGAPSAIPSDETFAAGLKVETRQRSDHLKVTFTGPDPLVASTAVRSLIAAYEQSFKREQERAERSRMDQLTSRRDALRDESRRLKDEARQIADGRSSAEVDPLCNAAADRLRKLQGALSDVQLAMAGGPDVVQRPVSVQKGTLDSVADDVARSYVLERTRIENQIVELHARGFGPNHPAVLRLESLAAAYRERLEKYTNDYNSTQAAQTVASAPKTLSDREAALQQSTDAAAATLKQLTAQKTGLKALEDRIAGIDQNLKDTENRLDALATESVMSNRLTIVSNGDRPLTAVYDNRAKMVSVGAMGGFGLSLGALVLAGSLRRRYRFAADVADDLGHRVPFVGVLPDVGADPSLRAIGAHGVHELRVQIQPSGPGHPRTYLVTSSAPGEGKTDIVLTLALSFAAAGFRTLVIDADSMTRRLSGVLGVADLAGLSEAIDGAAPNIRKVRAGFSILAAGSGGARAGARLSPVAAAKLLSGLTEGYEVVLIDGDPILGGLRGSTLAPLVDGVLLAVSRDQEQTPVLNAARQIQMLGGELTGVVFNRAPGSDFHDATKSMSRPSSIYDQVPAEWQKRFGPLVCATLASLSMTRSTDLEVLPSASALELNKGDAWRRSAA